MIREIAGYLAVGSFNIVLLAFPLYICLAGASVLIAIKLGLRKKSAKIYV